MLIELFCKWLPDAIGPGLRLELASLSSVWDDLLIGLQQSTQMGTVFGNNSNSNNNNNVNNSRL
jgi:hypothetical protein